MQFDAASRPDPADPEYFARAHEEHEAIAAALHAKAPKRARKLMERHLRKNAEHYRRRRRPMVARPCARP